MGNFAKLQVARVVDKKLRGQTAILLCRLIAKVNTVSQLQTFSRAVLSLFCVIFFVGCPSSCGGEDLNAKKEAKAKKMIREFPAISTSQLNPAQVELFAKMANEEVCPCECPETFATCLQANTKCKSAQVLGQWIVDELSQGAPEDKLLSPLSYEIAMGCRAAPQLIDIEGYPTKGSQSPKVTVVEYADFDCAHCKAMSGMVKEFVASHSDDVKFVFKYFPLEHTPASKLAACAVEAAAKQGKGWEMHDAAFGTAANLSMDLLVGHAKTLGLNMTKFKKDLEDKDIIKKVERSKSESLRLGIQGTPAIFFNGRPFSLLNFGLSGFEMRLAYELARDESTCN